MHGCNIGADGFLRALSRRPARMRQFPVALNLKCTRCSDEQREQRDKTNNTRDNLRAPLSILQWRRSLSSSYYRLLQIRITGAASEAGVPTAGVITRCQPTVNSQVPAEAIRGEAGSELLGFGLVGVGSGLEGPDQQGASSSTGCLNTDALEEKQRQRSRSLPPCSLALLWLGCSQRTQTLLSHQPDKAHQ